MTDKRGRTPDDPEFMQLDHDTWVLVGRGGKQEYIYQKIADNNPLPLVKSSATSCGAPDWRRFRELETGMSWAEIAKSYEVATNG